MKNLKFVVLSCLIMALFLITFQFNQFEGFASEENQCVKCHTSARMLIGITREIAKSRPVIKSENEGEG